MNYNKSSARSMNRQELIMKGAGKKPNNDDLNNFDESGNVPTN